VSAADSFTFDEAVKRPQWWMLWGMLFLNVSAGLGLISQLSPLAQAKLLRVIQERQFQPLGSNSMVKVNVRIITATNSDLIQDVASGKFRSDLYYRLNSFTIHLTPLREHKEDILPLFHHFLPAHHGPRGQIGQGQGRRGILRAHQAADLNQHVRSPSIREAWR
jgi:transcriptional regulator of aromatic amino acid metabolism